MELNELRRILWQVLLLPVFVLVALAATFIWQFRQSNNTVVLIEQSDHRIALANLLGKLIVDEETGLRGYQTTGDATFLQPYYQSDGPIRATVAELQSITTPGKGEHLHAFVTQHTAWEESFAVPMIAIIKAGGNTSNVQLNLIGKMRMDATRESLAEMTTTAEQRRSERINGWHAQNRKLITLLSGLALFMGVALGLFTRSRLQAVLQAFRRALLEQQRRSEELFVSEQNLRTTLTSIGDGVITCDADGSIQMMNVVAQELTGWAEGEARDKRLEEVFHIVDEVSREPMETPVSKVKRHGLSVGPTNHTVLIRKDGTELNIDDSGSPIRDEAGHTTGVVMVFRDVTTQRKTNAALLANEKLAVAGRLAATIAHEIHNPLDSVSNLLFLLEGGSSEAESKHFLAMARSELSRVTQISRAMLSLYREAKAPVPVNLQDMLDGLLLLMERRFAELGVTVSSTIPGELNVDGFPAELRQVFTNLITNAAEAAGREGTVTLRAQATSNTGQSGRPEAGVLVEITDSGPGISAEVHARLFQPFFTTKGENGTGLGLWVSQGIIRKHAGTLDLANQTEHEGSGTTASVYLANKPLIALGGD